MSFCYPSKFENHQLIFVSGYQLMIFTKDLIIFHSIVSLLTCPFIVFYCHQSKWILFLLAIAVSPASCVSMMTLSVLRRPYRYWIQNLIVIWLHVCAFIPLMIVMACFRLFYASVMVVLVSNTIITLIVLLTSIQLAISIK